MDLEILKMKISTFRGEGRRVRISDEALLREILLAWEQWKGPMKELYRAIGVSQTGMASIIGRAKKLRREGHFPVEDFKEVKIEGNGNPPMAIPSGPGPCIGIELCWDHGKINRFPEADQIIDFLKMVA